MVYTNQYLFPWHVNRNIVRNEKLSEQHKTTAGYFVKHENKWVLVNQTLTSLRDVTEQVDIPIGGFVELSQGKKILFSNEEGGRLALVTLVGAD
ncbi:hypothetical protein D3C86_1919030 [compost metagenome]